MVKKVWDVIFSCFGHNLKSLEVNSFPVWVLALIFFLSTFLLHQSILTEWFGNTLLFGPDRQTRENKNTVWKYVPDAGIERISDNLEYLQELSNTPGIFESFRVSVCLSKCPLLFIINLFKKDFITRLSWVSRRASLPWAWFWLPFLRSVLRKESNELSKISYYVRLKLLLLNRIIQKMTVVSLCPRKSDFQECFIRNCPGFEYRNIYCEIYIYWDLHSPKRIWRGINHNWI